MLAPLIILAWCFAVGACVGSFLNVVAWRLPLGMSLLWPSSHCPACGRAILLRDNVPIFGWILLRGRCRACHAPISPRYPTVEFVTALAFAAIAYVELVQAGANLPDYLLSADRVLPLDALVGVWVYHSLLAALLITAALFERDGSRVPTTYVVAVVVGGLVPALVFPDLQPVPFAITHAAVHADALDRSATGLVGLFAGAALGAALAWAAAAGRWRAIIDSPTAIVALAGVGAFLGWQAAASSACLAAALLAGAQVASVVTGRRLVLPVHAICLAALVQLLAWRAIDDLAERYLPPAGWATPLVAWSALLGVIWVLATATAKAARPTDKNRRIANPL